MTYTEDLNNEDQEKRFLNIPIKKWMKGRSKLTNREEIKLEEAREEDQKPYSITTPDVLHDYFITRQDHTSDEPCKSSYCGVCYDYFIDDLEIQKNISEDKGFKTKLCQSSIKMLEEKYGYDAYRIFRNRYASNHRYESSKQNKKSTIEELTKDDVEKLIDKFGGIPQFVKNEYL